MAAVIAFIGPLARAGGPHSRSIANGDPCQCPVGQESKLTASDAASGDRFGIYVSIDGDRAIAGAYLHGGMGAAYIYRRKASGTWTQEAMLTAIDAEPGDWFGVSVGISGDLAIVGAQLDDDAGSASGSAYMFRRQAGNAWTHEAKLTATDAAATDEFGHCVAISGDMAVVSSQYDDDNGGNSGSAYVFRRAPGGTWTQEAKLTASDGAALDEFSNSVACDGDTIIIGARRHDGTLGAESGAAYIFHREPGGRWIEQAKLTAADGEAGDEFGFGVSVSGDAAVVGARLDDDVASQAGAAYVFRRQPNGTWLQEDKLTASDGAFLDVFGESVSISGDLALIGSRQNDQVGIDSGAAYLFRRQSGGGAARWIQIVKLASDDLAAGDFFGISVSISGGRAIVGANLDDDAGDQSGAAYVFDVSECTPVPGDVNGDGLVNVTDLLAVINSWGQCPAPPGQCPADVNGDGVVDVQDLLIVINNWS